jgi:hypothetical protein
MIAQPEPVCRLVGRKDAQVPEAQAMMIVDVIQGTPEWRQARVGSLGASRLHDAVARTSPDTSHNEMHRGAESAKVLLQQRLSGDSRAPR